MRISNEDVLAFARWSGDRNPLHVDPSAARRTAFGRPIAHGMLTTIRALAAVEPCPVESMKRLDVEFRGAIAPEMPWTVEHHLSTSTSLIVRAGEATAMTLRLNADRDPVPVDREWADGVLTAARRPHTTRPEAADLDIQALAEAQEIVGIYSTDGVPTEYLSGCLAPLQARVLALCSYVIGMELPGLRSLFTRAQLDFADPVADTSELLYRVRTLRLDPHFRLLDLRLEIATPDGTPVAAGDLRSYVRFSPSRIDPRSTAAALSPAAQRLAGKVVLVTGGTRGLGAELTTAFAMAGCHVYASFNSDRLAAEDLRSSLPANVTVLEGDAGEAAWCESTLAGIRERHGELDVLVLNACTPPAVWRFGMDSADAYHAYVSANLRLAQVPLAASLRTLAASGGTIVGISSSFVSDPPAGFGHYVALKQAVESTIQTAVRECEGVRAVIARPPRLQTAWNDTPTGVLGTISARDAAVAILNGLVDAADSASPVRTLEAFESLPSSVQPAASDPEFVLSLAASFTAEPLVEGLEFWFKELGVRGDVKVAPYGQILQTLLSPSVDAGKAPGMHVVLLRTRDWLRELRREDAESTEFLRSYLASTARDVERAVRSHRAQASVPTLLVLCPSAPESPDLAEALLEEIEVGLAARLTALPGLTVVRARDFHDTYKVTDDLIADHVREHIAHIPYQAGYLHTLATIVMRHVHRTLVPARKVVVVDCDNTLWRGVVGEAGADGLAFDDGHRALHETLTRLGESGVLIALCSKNEEADVWSVFESRPDLGLRRDSIVTAAINWQPKSANLRAMAERLNLGLDSFVFIDDNPVECAEVRAACPEVLTLEWPQDPAHAKRLLQHTWELDARGGTAEDRRRTEMYQQEFQRQELQSQTLTFRDFIDSLELTVDIAPMAPDDVKRASQLTLRTNQFNFTTIRRDEAAMQTLAAAGTHEIRTIRVRDRFGDYGLVGLLIAEPRDGALHTDSFLLSCRVLGRGVEHRMVEELGRLAAAAGASRVLLRVEPTPRNTPARQFLESIAPDGSRAETGGTLEVDLPADAAIGMRFEPPAQAPPPVTEGEKKPASTRPADDAVVRSRESQIRRTVQDLSTVAGLIGAVEGKPTTAVRPPDVPADASFVFESFAAALGVDADRVRAVDSLEGLGCDSFKIVEITVSLLERFPWLPSTLLFEHRTVSEIAARIQALSKPHESHGPQPAPSAGMTPHDASPARDIAVVGMHLRCAGAASLDDLWTLLSAGGVAVAPVPADRRYFLGRLADSRPHFAGLIDHVDRFEAELFGITPREAELMDPQLRMFLEVVWSALEDAGMLGAGPEVDTGVFAGVMYGDYGHRANPAARASESPFKCWEGFSLANRVSQVFGFSGPSVAVDTACSSSATAIHLACRALAAGDCQVAIAGGVNLILDPDRFVQLGRLGILSESGRCLPFGAAADGTVLGEGAGVVVLRPLADAMARGDRIYGVIKGTGVSTGSGTVGFTAPNPQAQAVAVRRALAQAAIDPRTVTYVETHGTGTALGDPIEVRGLTLGYGTAQLSQADLNGRLACTIGSIKPNIGHLEAGAGVLGLIKVMLQLHRRHLVPSVTSPAPNPQIPFAGSGFEVQRSLTPWSRPMFDLRDERTEFPRRAGLNSFGVGGANVHVIVEEAPDVPAPEESVDRPLHLLSLSARTDEGLRQRAADVAVALETGTATVADLCFSANTAQRPLPKRAAIVAGRREELVASLRSVAEGLEPDGGVVGSATRASERPRIAFLFTGQGSQYAGMGRELYDTQPIFRAALDRCCALFRPLLDSPLEETLFALPDTPEAARLHQTAFTQPALFSLGFALSELWLSWGIRPDVVVGHSIGELTAMCVAGGLSLEDAVTVVAARGRLMQALPAGGGMISIMAPEARVLPALAGYEDRVSLAAVNGPAQVVISGDATLVTEIAGRLAAEGIRNRPLTVSHAFHSPLMQPMLAEYRTVLNGIRFDRPQITFASAVLGAIADAELTTAEYWLRNVIDTVRFTDALRTADETGVTAYVEMGPQPVLVALAQQCLGGEDRLWLPSIRKDGRAWPALLAALGEFFVRGVEIDWAGFDRPYHRRRTSLPPYPFGGRRYWISGVPAMPALPGLSGEASPNEAAAAYALGWNDSAALQSAPSTSGAWVVVADAGGVGVQLAHVLKTRGDECLVVSADDADARLGGLVTQTPATRFRGVVYAHGLDCASASVGDEHTAAATMDRVARVLKTLVESAPSGKLWILTRAAVQAGLAPDHAINPSQAALWGFGRCVALEQPERWGGLIDLSPELDIVDAAEAVAAEITSGTDDQVALRGGRRLSPRLERYERKPTTGAIHSASTYLITGGLGALGLHLADWLVARGARHLVLTGRRGCTSPEVQARIDLLRTGGATVEVVAADVARPEGVAAALSAVPANSPLGGVFHAAGVDDITPVTALDANTISRVMAAKATGAWLLHQATLDRPDANFVMFSSIASILGSPGRAAYAAANAFLDALVHERRRCGLPGLAINWGPWAGGGMASAEALEQYERVGNRGLQPSAALAALDSLLDDGIAQAMVADVDWAVFRRTYEARRARPIVAALADEREAAPAPAAAGAAWIATLSACEAEQRPARLMEMLRAEIAQTLGFERADDIPPDLPFRELGMDSLMAADFAQRLQKRTGIRSTAMVFEYNTVVALAGHLLERLALPEVEQLGAVASAAAVSVAGAMPAGRIQPSLSPAPVPFRSEAQGPLPPSGTNGQTEGYHADIEEEVFAFQQTAWPRRSAALIPARWRWMFVESADRLGIAPRVWLHRRQGRIVGHNGAIPVRLKLGAEERTTAWLVDTMVLPEFRDEAVGARLMIEAHEDLPFALSLGQTDQMRQILLRLGWHTVAPLQTAMALIRPERVLSGKMARPAALAAGLALRAQTFARQTAAPSSTARIERIERFGDAHDRIWERAAVDIGCAVRRDASYLNWKYIDQPGQNFRCLEVQLPSGESGVMVLMFREPDEAYRYRRAFLVDLVAPLGNRRLLEEIGRAALRVATEQGADALLCLHVSPALSRALQAVGFRMREPGRHLLVRPETLEEPARSLVLDADTWFVTHGDSDIDRP